MNDHFSGSVYSFAISGQTLSEKVLGSIARLLERIFSDVRSRFL